MEYRLSSVDEFIEYYDQYYRVDRHDLMSMYKLSEKTIYRNIAYKDSPVGKVKINAGLLREIREGFKSDNRLTDEHIRVAEKRVLFNEYDVFLHLVETNNFQIYFNVIGAGKPAYRRIDNIKLATRDVWLSNYDNIMWYVWQAHRTLYLNAIQGLGRYYDLKDESDKTRYQRALQKMPHIKFVICGATSYVSLEHGYYRDQVGFNSYLKFLEDFTTEQLQFDLYNDDLIADLHNDLEENNRQVIAQIREYLSTASTYHRNKFFRSNKHLGEQFLGHFDEYR